MSQIPRRRHGQHRLSPSIQRHNRFSLLRNVRILLIPQERYRVRNRIVILNHPRHTHLLIHHQRRERSLAPRLPHHPPWIRLKIPETRPLWRGQLRRIRRNISTNGSNRQERIHIWTLKPSDGRVERQLPISLHQIQSSLIRCQLIQMHVLDPLFVLLEIQGWFISSLQILLFFHFLSDFLLD